MSLAYLDTSAAFKLVTEEVESEALAAELVRDDSRQLASSWLLHTEMHCAANRNPQDISLDSIQAVLRLVTLVDVSRGDLIAASGQSTLRANDAIHLSVAERLGADELITYDGELAEAARRVGLGVISPA